MSGTKRHPIGRRSQNPLITDEALRLFAELERTPRRQRDSKAFKAREHELMRLLGLVPEYWTMCSVLDRSEGPCHPPGYIRNDHWHKVRGIRVALLEAAKSLQAATE
jgi:hypothetical protein